MSNIEISKINIDETQLLIKDAQNRQDLNSLSTEVQSISTDLNSLSTSISTNYLPLSSGTLTGQLNINLNNTFINLIANNVDATTTPNSNKYENIIFSDKNNLRLSGIETTYCTNNSVDIKLMAYNQNSDSNNYFLIGRTAEGENTYSMASPDNFRDAINAVNKSGDTMMGSLRFNNANLFFQRNSVNCGQIYPSSGNAIVLRNFSEGSSKSEYFYTPTPDENLQNDKSYYFLTTKNVVTTAQGGTGGTDSGWHTWENSTVFTGSIYYRKIGEWVFVTTHGAIRNVSEISTADLALFTISPSDLRPYRNFAGTLKTNTMGLMTDLFINAASGQASIRARIGEKIPKNAYIYMSFMYFV